MGAGRSGLFHGTRGGMKNMSNNRFVETNNTISACYLFDGPDIIGHGSPSAFGSELGYIKDDATILLNKNIRNIKVNDRVITLVAKEGYPSGTLGIVISIYALQKICEVELLIDGYPKDIVLYRFDEIEVCEQ